jgi:hypothetical protein
MVHALHHLRSIVLWGDALCLPQNTVIERCLVNLTMREVRTLHHLEQKALTLRLLAVERNLTLSFLSQGLDPSDLIESSQREFPPLK